MSLELNQSFNIFSRKSLCKCRMPLQSQTSLSHHPKAPSSSGSQPEFQHIPQEVIVHVLYATTKSDQPVSSSKSTIQFWLWTLLVSTFGTTVLAPWCVFKFPQHKEAFIMLPAHILNNTVLTHGNVLSQVHQMLFGTSSHISICISFFAIYKHYPLLQQTSFLSHTCLWL